MSTPPDASDDELTSAILEIAIDVHKQLGRHQPESVYQEALAVSLRDDDLQISVEHEFPIELKGRVVGHGSVDILVEGAVVLELKAVRSTTEEHFRQLGRNVEECSANRGLLLNYGEATLGIRRYIEKSPAA